MVLDFSESKSFLIRVIIYFIVLGFSLRFIGYFMTEQLPVLVEKVLNSNIDGDFDFLGNLVSLELVLDWIMNDITHYIQGILSAVFAGVAFPSIGAMISQISLDRLFRPVVVRI